uniref:Ig-like domain-containing protein n=1 Tax=Loxodonta africana TaxID=9785 RepID=G3UFM0_LOXAF
TACRLLCWVVLCLLGTGSADTGITQRPKYLVIGMGNKKSLMCEQSLKHNSMYWYKQVSDKPPELMFRYDYQKLATNETVPGRFSPECPDSSHLYLHMDALELGDSAMYLCASS